MKTFKIYSIAIVVAALTVSCSKDDDTYYPPIAPQTHLIKTGTTTNTFDSNVLVDRYEYNDQNQLVSILTSYDATTFTRNAEGKISHAEISYANASYTQNYLYNSTGELVKKETFSSANALLNRDEYKYFSDRYEERHYNTQNVNTFTQINYYTPDRKNIASTIMKTEGDVVQWIYTNTYDNKVGFAQVAPYSQLPKPFYNANNVIEESATNAVGDPAGSIIHKLTYTTDGYPLTTNDGQAGYTRTLDYIIK